MSTKTLPMTLKKSFPDGIVMEWEKSQLKQWRLHDVLTQK